MNEVAKTQREKVDRLEQALSTLPPVAFAVRDLFAPGVYLRELTIPPGSLIVGATHKTEHLSIVSKGHIFVETDDGLVSIQAPYTFVSQPGAKRAGYAMSETVWTTVHANPTNSRDVEWLIKEISDKELQELAGGVRNPQVIHAIEQQKENSCQSLQ